MIRTDKLIQLDVLVLALALAAVLAVANTFWLRAQAPSPGFSAKPGEGGWVVTHIVRNASQGGIPAHWLGATVTQACAVQPPSRCVPLNPVWMTDSLTMPSGRAIREFIHSQQALLSLASQTGQQVVLHARLADTPPSTSNSTSTSTPAAALVTMHPARELMSERYILTLLAPVMVYVVGCAMLAFLRRTREVWVVFSMCAGFLVFMLARSWYTSRVWAQADTGWWLALQTFRFGVVLCGTATVLTLWKVRLHKQHTWLPLSGCALVALVVLAHAVGAIDSTAWGYRYPTLGYLVMVVCMGVHAWQQRRHLSPSDRLRDKTNDILLLMGFAPVLTVMPLWTFRPDLPQISDLQNIALGLSSIPAIIMVARSSHYQLHTFWWRLWLVLVAAVLALVSAAWVVVLSGASAAWSLAVMLVIASWVVYALRGWLEHRLIGTPPVIDQFLPQLMSLQALQGEALEAGWNTLLAQVFAPSSTQIVGNGGDHVQLLREGESMVLPALGPSPALQLTGAAQFTRSFGRRDVELGNSLHALALLGLKARDSFMAGALQERKRIAADLHDDIGGKLLHMARLGGDEGSYARNTLDDLRTITRGLSAQPRPLHELLADIYFQLNQRAERAKIDFEWRTAPLNFHSTHQVGSRQCTVLTSVCGELLRNAMQHQGVRRVAIHFAIDATHCHLTCHNDGAATDPALWPAGLGTTSIRRRIHDLQGQCKWASADDGDACVVFHADWPCTVWLGAEV